MGAWGEGSLREKRPGVFEIRVAVGVDPVSGRTVQRSFWFHGALEDAEERRRELAAQFAEYRSIRRAAPFLTVGRAARAVGVCPARLATVHVGRGPVERQGAERRSHRRTAGGHASTRGRAGDHGPMAGGRGRGVGGLRPLPGAALRCRLGPVRIDHRSEPARDMRGPPRPGTRMHVPEQDVLALLRMSEVLVEKAEAAFDGSWSSRKHAHKAEQVRLLVRLAADSGARRGELAALKFGDLDGRVLHHRARRLR